MAISLGSVLQQTALPQAVKNAAKAHQQDANALPAKTITVSEAAVKQARVIMLKEERDPAVTWLRVGVQGGGCSGLAYMIDFTTHKDTLDVELEFHGLKVLVDRKSLIYLGGTELDWATGLQAGWRFNNPNQKKGCSCGDSFSI